MIFVAVAKVSCTSTLKMLPWLTFPVCVRGVRASGAAKCSETIIFAAFGGLGIMCGHLSVRPLVFCESRANF